MQNKFFIAVLLFTVWGFNSEILLGSLVTRDLGSVTLDAKNSGQFALDVDLDGTVDFNFQTFFSNDPAFLLGFDQIKVPFGSQNGIAIRTQTNDGFPPASFLVSGDVVGPASLFSNSTDTANLYSSDPILGATGEFGGKRGAVGLRFESGGNLRFAFADITIKDVNSPSAFDLTLNSVSYESVPGQAAIVAVPEPTSAALVGVVLLSSIRMLRKRKSKSDLVANNAT